MPTIEIERIITDDPAFLVRDQLLDEATVAAYAEEPERLPPVELWSEPDTNAIYPLDGQHRLAAHRQRDLAQIAVTYFEGDRAEAEARARTANLRHGLRLSAAEQRRARLEVIERLYERSNNWIAEDLHCSPNTVAALRAKLEEAGRIPRLDRLKRKGGGDTPRHYETEAEEETGPAASNVQPPSDLMEPEPEPDNQDGGYDVEDSEGAAKPTGGGEPASSRPEPAGDDFSPSDHTAVNTTLKLAQLGQPLAMEATLYVDDQAHSIPVTLLAANGPIAGAPQTAPDHTNILVIGADTARRLGLIL